MLKRIEIELNEESKEKSILDSNVESIEGSEEKLNVETDEDVEEKAIAKIMEEEGMKVNNELREMFKDSYFFPYCFDDAIIGVNPLTQSINYSYVRLGWLRILFGEYTRADYCDTLYGANKMVQWINALTLEETNGKVKPTLCLLEDETTCWNDIQEGCY
jgi:hypothetical protein